MSVKITDNTKQVNNNIAVKTSIFLRLMTDEIVKISTPKTPKREGYLRRDVTKQVLGLNAKIVWEKNYAARMERVQFANYTTPGTGPHYAEDSVKEAGKRIAEVAKRAGLI